MNRKRGGEGVVEGVKVQVKPPLNFTILWNKTSLAVLALRAYVCIHVSNQKHHWHLNQPTKVTIT